MDAIRKELGESDGSVAEEYRKKIADAGMPEAVQKQAESELSRMERMGESNAEASMIAATSTGCSRCRGRSARRSCWTPSTRARCWTRTHAGLDDVKRRITEYLAVRKLRAARGLADDRRSGAILTLIGPPGTGKTSIGESIARATGRKFVRMSLGGVRDEAEIRGHRRTYIGALPGRLVRALKDAGTMNPVILLDEVDKLGADWRGDPSAALLEVLDPAQNHSFRDHYLDVELDLSHVLFLATANVADTIPGPLLDRMEVVRFDGYTTDEKLAIARDYLWAGQVERNGLQATDVTLEDDVLRLVVTDYTREAGVRQLERELGTLLRKTATRVAAGHQPKPSSSTRRPCWRRCGGRRFHQEVAARTGVPGVATGLAVTGAGGDVLFVEAASMAGKGGLVLTGQLGDVMKESARIALTYVQSHAPSSASTSDLRRPRVPRARAGGAIPKDGPSAGVTMVAALTSLLTGRPVKSTVGMTGEVTLQGRVLPIGGLKQKVLAAHAAGLTDVILPDRNAPDLDDVPSDVREHMRFHPVKTADEMLAPRARAAVHRDGARDAAVAAGDPAR
jgi:ATP-dependent Lon protease